MGYDYSKKLRAEGQTHSNACWAASISWWTQAMALNYKRSWQSQLDLLAEFNQYTATAGAIFGAGIKAVCESAKVRIFLQYVSPARLKTDFDFSSPSIIIYNYPAVGGTHMNVIFDQKGDTVMCMEPFYPMVATRTGERLGTYIRRPLSFFANSQEVGIGCLPLQDAFFQMQ